MVSWPAGFVGPAALRHDRAEHGTLVAEFATGFRA